MAAPSVQLLVTVPASRRRISRPTLLTLAWLCVLLMMSVGAYLVWKALAVDHTAIQRSSTLLLAAVVLFPPFGAVWMTLASRIRNGHWHISPEQQATFAARFANKSPKPNRVVYYFALFALAAAGSAVLHPTSKGYDKALNLAPGLIFVASTAAMAFDERKKSRQAS